MTEPSLALAYSTNVHPARGTAALVGEVVPAAGRVRALAGEAAMALDLHLDARTAHAFDEEDGQLDALAEALAAEGLHVASVNAFPLGEFHAPRVKDAVYRPDWSEPERLEATLAAARVLARLLAPGGMGYVSTLTGTYALWPDAAEREAACAGGLAACARALAELGDRTDRRVALALEPEPFTTAERTGEAVRHIDRVRDAAGEAGATLLGLNLDLCHLAVGFEGPKAALDAAGAAGVPILGLHASAAPVVPRPGENKPAIAALGRFDEPRWLHPVYGCDASGRVVLREPDLGLFLDRSPRLMKEIAEARCHFHVPLAWPGDALLGTTRDLTAEALRLALAADEPPRVVAETYTWNALPGAGDLAEGLAAEIRWIRAVLAG